MVKGNIVQIEGTFFKYGGGGLARVIVKEKEKSPTMEELRKKVDKMYFEIMGSEPQEIKEVPTIKELEKKIDDISDAVRWEKGEKSNESY